MATRGRKPSYNPEWLDAIRAWARDGATDKEIYERLGVKKTAFYEWKLKYPELAEALKRSKAFVDAQVVDSLLKRALGYEYEETKAIVEQDAKGGVVSKRIEKVKKRVAPDTTACIFWLKNRQPEQWREAGDPNGGSQGTIKDLVAAIRESRKK